MATAPKTSPALLKANGRARIPVPRELLSKFKKEPNDLQNIIFN